MIKKIVYIYNDKEYSSTYEVRNAISIRERKIFGIPSTDEEWKKLGVTKIIKEIEEVKPIQPIKTKEQLTEEIREKRNRLLKESDFYLMPDYPCTDTDLITVKSYRQALRDISKQETFPYNIVWPEVPSIFGDNKDA